MARSKTWIPSLELHDRLRLVRTKFPERLGGRMTMDQMAVLLDVPRGTWATWERGDRKPNRRDLHWVAGKTGVDEAWLVGDESLKGDALVGASASQSELPPRRDMDSKSSGVRSRSTGLRPSGFPSQQNLDESWEPPDMDLG